jgi:hypothetical protein
MTTKADEVLLANIEQLEIVAADQEREMLEEKRQYEEAEARLKETKATITSLKRALSAPAKKSAKAE